jgi:hypothetical protein
MFTKLTVKELKKIISTFKKQHNLANYSHLKKKDLIHMLEAKYILKDGKLYLKPIATPIIAPTIVEKTNIAPIPVTSNINDQLKNIPNKNIGTKGQQHMEKTVNKMENKAKAKDNYLKEKEFARRIKGK